jgi:hypothetical protein
MAHFPKKSRRYSHRKKNMRNRFYIMDVKGKMFSKLRIFIICCFCSCLNAVILPKNIHFIWIGNQIPAKYLENIVSFAETNPDYQVKVWTDRPEQFASLSGLVSTKSIDDAIRAMPKPLQEYFFHEIQAPGYSDENEKLIPNFAAASDLLRVEILKLEGGIYIDTDTSLIEKKGFGDIDAPLGYLVPIEPHTFSFCNFLMATTAGNPILLEIENTMMKNYAKFLIEPDLAQEMDLDPSRYGIRPKAILRVTCHSGNFWKYKLGEYRTIIRYVLAHETTGLNMFYQIFTEQEILESIYKQFVAPNLRKKAIYIFDLIDLTRFKFMEHLRHEGNLFWFIGSSAEGV